MDQPPVPIENVDALLAVVGQWNLYDMEIRGLRFRADAPAGAELEADLYLPGGNLRPRAAGAPDVEHAFVFRFSGVEGLTLDAFGGQNIVGEYEFAAATTAAGRPGIRVAITGVAGGDLALTCRAVAVVSVSEQPVRRAP